MSSQRVLASNRRVEEVVKCEEDGEEIDDGRQDPREGSTFELGGVWFKSVARRP